MTTTNEPTEISTAAWEAVSNRDRHYDGKFVYAALTTGIYCRPSCPARHPHRRNTLIFPTAAEAEQRGYIPCRRCHPDSGLLTPTEQTIKAVLVYIKSQFDQTITLDTLSQVTGLSPNHLQQTFKRIVGLSPKVFCDVCRIVNLKQRLKQGESVTSAGYAVGYGSSRALYEKATKNLGMTPATYQRGGEGVRIGYAIASAVLGPTLIAGTVDGICTVLVGENEKSLAVQLRDEFPKAIITRDKVPVSKWLAAIQSFRAEDPLLAKLTIDLRIEVFQAKVWKVLQ
ncbi:MAG TPA: Ada metal-binding domain-containing protein [Pirellulales bacterium]|nr:Ada metal-binding domain-containing protein [Pirellulales bacterium]